MSSVKWLPSQADIYRRLVDRIAAPDVTIDDAAEIIACDVAMSARVVYLVSSGFFGSPQRVVNAAHAGQTARAGKNQVADDGIRHLCTPIANWLGERCRGCEPSQLDCCAGGQGILAFHDERPYHHQGYESWPACCTKLADWRWEAAQGRETGGDPRWNIARRRSSPAAILSPSGDFPDTIIQQDQSYYQTPLLCAEQVFGPLTAVHVADACLGQLFASVTGQRTRLDIEYLRRIGCADRVENWRHICHTCLPEGAVS